jgi:diguanylate cyclase (GGDEF)-like protein
LQQLSSADGLTGLHNRRYFDQQLQTVWEARLRQKSDIALLFFDVDYFKKYNDSQGHQMGDDALIQVAQVIGRHADACQGCAARYGGEEFVLLLSGCNLRRPASWPSRSVRMSKRWPCRIPPRSAARWSPSASAGGGTLPASARNRTGWCARQMQPCIKPKSRDAIALSPCIPASRYRLSANCCTGHGLIISLFCETMLPGFLDLSVLN